MKARERDHVDSELADLSTCRYMCGSDMPIWMDRLEFLKDLVLSEHMPVWRERLHILKLARRRRS